MKKAEEILREYVQFEDVNGNVPVTLLPLTIVDAMEEYVGEKSKWVSVDERLPNGFYNVLGLTRKGRMLITWIDRGTLNFDDNDIDIENDCYTHWMELPKPPTQ